MDECCLAFDKGYSYQSKYQGQKYYVQMMYKMPSQVAAQEYSFEMNDYNSSNEFEIVLRIATFRHDAETLDEIMHKEVLL